MEKEDLDPEALTYMMKNGDSVVHETVLDSDMLELIMKCFKENIPDMFGCLKMPA